VTEGRFLCYNGRTILLFDEIDFDYQLKQI
jgi:hypothetical protein